MLWAQEKGSYRRSRSGQFTALNGVGEVIWPENEHKFHGSAVPSGTMLFPTSFGLFSVIASWERPCNSSPNILHPLSCFAFLHRILWDICSWIYHLPPPQRKGRESCLCCSLLSLEQCLTHTNEALEKYLLSKWMKQWSSQPRWPFAEVDGKLTPFCQMTFPKPRRIGVVEL